MTADEAKPEKASTPTREPVETAAPSLDDGLARRILAALPEAVCCKDPEGRILFWNAAAERLTGYTHEEISRRPGSLDEARCTDWSGEPVREDDLPSVRCMTEDRPVTRNIFLRRNDGRRIWVELRCAPVRDETGAPAGCLIVLRDVTSTLAIGEALRQARRAAEIDPLTGLANRRNLDRMLDIHLDVLAREGRPFSLVLADLDHFKSIKDAWGHAVGDRTLIAFADLLQSHSRAEDLVVRFGGEEFVVLLPDHPLDVAAKIAERLRAATPSAAPPEREGRALTASFGVAQAVPGESAADLVRRADAALYRAKSGGRDRVEVDEPE